MPGLTARPFPFIGHFRDLMWRTLLGGPHLSHARQMSELQETSLTLLDLLRVAATVAQFLPFIKRLVKRREMRERLMEDLLPTLRELERSMEGLVENGRKLTGTLNRAKMPLHRKDANELALTWADTADAAVEVIERVHRLAREARKIAAFETFMEDLRTTDPPVFEMLKLLERSYQGGLLDVGEFPTFVRLYGPKRGRQRTLKKAVETAAVEATPLVKKAKAVRIGKRLEREVSRRLLKSVRRLRTASASLRKLDSETAARMYDATPDWVQPLVALAKEVDAK